MRVSTKGEKDVYIIRDPQLKASDVPITHRTIGRERGGSNEKFR